MHGDQPPVQRQRSHQLQQERLARSILADHEPDRRPAVGDLVEVGEQRLDLGGPAHLDVLVPDAGHDTGPQGAQNDLAVAGADVAWLAHRSSPSTA